MPVESPPLHDFLKSIGKIQHHLHTIVVGLSAVESGAAVKPDDLDITWKVSDPMGSAREARRFALASTLVFVAEGLCEYAKRVLSYRALAAGSEIKLPDERADRLAAVVKLVDLTPQYIGIAPVLIVHWRNRIVHQGSNASLNMAQEQLLVANAKAAFEAFKNVDVAKLLGDFERNLPTLKDVTVLIAMTVKALRQVDQGLLLPSTSREVRMWLAGYELLPAVERFERAAESGGHRDPRARARHYLNSVAPTLADVYHRFGI